MQNYFSKLTINGLQSKVARKSLINAWLQEFCKRLYILLLLGFSNVATAFVTTFEEVGSVITPCNVNGCYSDIRNLTTLSGGSYGTNRARISDVESFFGLDYGYFKSFSSFDSVDGAAIKNSLNISEGERITFGFREGNKDPYGEDFSVVFIDDGFSKQVFNIDDFTIRN